MKGFTNNKTLIAFGLALFVVIALWLAVPLSAWTYVDSWTLDSDGNRETEFTTGDDITVVVNLTKETADILKGTSIKVDVPNSATDINVTASYCELYDADGHVLDNITYDDNGNYDTPEYGYGYDYGYNYYGYGYGYWYGYGYSEESGAYIHCYYDITGSENSEDGTYTYIVYLGVDTDDRTALENGTDTYTISAAATTGGSTTGGGGAPLHQGEAAPDDTFDISIECTNSNLQGDVYIDYTGSLLEEETTVKIEASTTNSVPGGFTFTTTIDDVSCEDIADISPTATSMEEGSCIITWELDGDETIEFKVAGSRAHKTDFAYDASACDGTETGEEEQIPDIPIEEKPPATVECTQEGDSVHCTVKDETGKPISGEEITIIGPDGTIYTYVSDVDGTFSFLATEPGRWAFVGTDYYASGSIMVTDATGGTGETTDEKGKSDPIVIVAVVGIVVILGGAYWWLTAQGGKGLLGIK